MRHYILTRSAYGPTVEAGERSRRLALLERVCAASLRAQTQLDLHWIVLIDRSDPELDRRIRAIRSSNLPATIRPAGNMVTRGGRDRPWSRQWAQCIDWSHGPILTSRLDDDDALVPEAMAWVREAAASVHPREHVVWTLPAGWRVAGRLVERVTYPVPMFSTLQVPPAARQTIYDASHLAAARLAPMRVATDEPAWLWVRHDLTRSNENMRQGFSTGGLDMEPISAGLKARFPIDWDLVESLPQRGAVIPDRDRVA